MFQFIVDSAAGGVIGSAATVTLMSFINRARGFLAGPAQRFQIPAIREVAKLAVAAKLDTQTDLRATGTTRLDDHWAVTVTGAGKTYRVRIPHEDPSDRTISVDMD